MMLKWWIKTIFCGSRKKKPIKGLVLCRFRGDMVCLVPFAGISFTMYQMKFQNWQHYPIGAKMARDGVYDLTGDRFHVYTTISDQRPVNGDTMIQCLSGFIWPVALRGWPGLRLATRCIFSNAGLWCRWTPAIVKSWRSKKI